MVAHIVPLISTIIPVYNGARYLPCTLESALAQDYSCHEIIVVDDGSTDSTATIAMAHPTLRYVFQTNQGHGAAKNTGIAAAQGDYLAFLDADDLWLPNKLSMQMHHLLTHAKAEIAICLMETLLEDDIEWPANLKKGHYGQTPPAYIPSALLVHRSVFDRLGGFAPIYYHSNDSDWFFRAHDAGLTIAIVPHVLLRHRLHQNNLSYQARAINAELLGLIRSSVKRKRA